MTPCSQSTNKRKTIIFIKYKTTRQYLLYKQVKIWLASKLKLESLLYKKGNNKFKMQPKKDITGFNIRKVYKKNFSISKNPEELPVYSPEIQFEKSYHPLTYTNTKKEKQLILDQTVNEAILNSKTYIDLKKAYQQNKKKNNQRLQDMNKQVTQLKQQKSDLQQQKQKVRAQKKKILQAIEQMTNKLQLLKQQNEQKRENVQHIYETEAQYFNELLLSMRFHAEYEHNIDPDRMTYEELLELEEKIGNVSKGLPEEVIEALEKIEVREEHCGQEEKCAVCYCNFEMGEVMNELAPCKHRFHYECVKTWLMKEKVCPLCKQELQFEAKEGKRQQNQQNEEVENNQYVSQEQEPQQTQEIQQQA